MRSLVAFPSVWAARHPSVARAIDPTRTTRVTIASVRSESFESTDHRLPFPNTRWKCALRGPSSTASRTSIKKRMRYYSSMRAMNERRTRDGRETHRMLLLPGHVLPTVCLSMLVDDTGHL